MANNVEGKALFPSRRFCIITLVVCAIILLSVELFGEAVVTLIGIGDDVLADMLKMILTRLVGGFFVTIVVLYMGYNVLASKHNTFEGKYILLIPCLAVAINNFPIVAVVTGSATLSKPWWYLFVLLVQCIAIAFFEEMAFRGIVLLSILEKRRTNVKDVIVSILLSSAVFGAIHLFNLLGGAGVGDVARQIGYSALIGAMCSCLLLRTGNIFYCILVHTVFDFGGYFISDLSYGRFWDIPTIIITVVIACLAFVWLFVDFLHLDTDKLDLFFIVDSQTLSQNK